MYKILAEVVQEKRIGSRWTESRNGFGGWKKEATGHAP